MYRNLSLPEQKLIEKCADLVIDSLLRLAEHSHPLFEEFYEAYIDEENNKLDMQEQLLESLTLWESIKEYPQQNINKLEVSDLLILKWVLMEHDELRRLASSLGKSKNNLINHIVNLIELRPLLDNKNLN